MGHKGRGEVSQIPSRLCRDVFGLTSSVTHCSAPFRCHHHWWFSRGAVIEPRAGAALVLAARTVSCWTKSCDTYFGIPPHVVMTF